MTTIYHLVGGDDEAWYDLGHYASREDAEADLASLEADYPGRPYWVEFRVEEVAVLPGRQPTPGLAHALVAFADLSEIESRWPDPNAPDSYQSEHGKPR